MIIVVLRHELLHWIVRCAFFHLAPNGRK